MIKQSIATPIVGLKIVSAASAASEVPIPGVAGYFTSESHPQARA